MFFKNITNTQWKNVHGKTTKLKGFEGAGGKKKKWKKKKRQKEKKKIDTTFPCGLNTLLISEEKKKDIKHHIIPNDVSYLLLGLKDIAFGKIYERLTKIGPTRTRN